MLIFINQSILSRENLSNRIYTYLKVINKMTIV